MISFIIGVVAGGAAVVMFKPLYNWFQNKVASFKAKL